MDSSPPSSAPPASKPPSSRAPSSGPSSSKPASSKKRVNQEFNTKSVEASSASKRPRIKDLSDEDVLLCLLENPLRLSTTEQKAFAGWLEDLQNGQLRLTGRQRDWARGTFENLGLIDSYDAENLASRMRAAGVKVDEASQETLNKVLGPKVLAPPVDRRHWA